MSEAAAATVVDQVMADAKAKAITSAAFVRPQPENIRRVLVADTPTLIRYLHNKDWALANEAVTEAGGRKDPAFVPSLTALATRKDGLMGVFALVQIGDPTAKAALRKIAKQPNQPARIQAALALAEFGDPAGKPALLEGLRTSLVSPVNFASMTPAQLRAAQNTEYFRDKYRIAHDLISLGYGHKKSELDDLLEGADKDRRLILPELAAKPWPHVKPALIRILGNPHEYHGNRKWAAIALGKAHYRPAVDPLIAALNDPSQTSAMRSYKPWS